MKYDMRGRDTQGGGAEFPRPTGRPPVRIAGAVVVADTPRRRNLAGVVDRVSHSASSLRRDLGIRVSGGAAGSGPERRDRGQSMMLVVVLMSALLLLPAAITAMAIGDINNASRSTPQSAALAAAYSGLGEYLNALNTNASFFSQSGSNFTGFNANGSGVAQNNLATPAFGGNGCSSGCSASTGMWEPVYNGSSAVTNECYFYESSVGPNNSVVATITGRSGPTAIANTSALQGGSSVPYCTTSSTVHYQFQTISAQFTNTPPTTSGYMYVDEYNVPSPIIYGLFSGNANTCGYYAYATNPNWTFGWIGTQATVEVWALWIGGYLFNNGWDFFEGPNGWNGAPGGAFGPSQGGALGSSEVFQYGTGSAPGYGNPGSNAGSGGAGALINGNGAALNDAYGAEFLASVTDGYGWYNSAGANADPYTDGLHNGTPNITINGYATTIGTNQTAAAGVGGPGTNNYDAAYSSSTDQPTGCGIIGSTNHDGFWTSFDSFNGNYNGQNPNGGAGTAGDGTMYTTDMYYVCGTTNAAANLGYGPNMTNVAMYSGDPYTTNAEQVNNENNPGPALFNWNFNWGVVAVTIFYIGFDPVAESYAAYPANSGPGVPYMPGGGATNEYVASGITGNVQMYIFKGQFFGISFGQSPINLGQAMPICNQPDNFPNGQSGSNSTISQLNTQIIPPYVAPSTSTSTTPDYALATMLNDASSGCIYRGNTQLTFSAGGGATVSTAGSITVSGQSITLGTVKTFGGSDVYAGGGPVNGCAAAGGVTPPNHLFVVVDGNAYVSGTVNGNYTVAVTDPCADVATNSYCTVPDTQVQQLPGTNGTVGSCVGGVNYCFSAYGGKAVQIQPSYVINRTGNSGYGATINGASVGTQPNGTYPESYNYSDTFYDSIYVTGNITYSGCSLPFTTATCSNYLGLLSQNNVVIAYPMLPAGSGLSYYVENSNAANNDITWTGVQSDLTDYDGTGCVTGDSCNKTARTDDNDNGSGGASGCSTSDTDGDHSCNEDGSEYEGVYVNWWGSGGCNSADAGESTAWTCFDNEPGGCHDNCSYSNNDSEPYASEPNDASDGDMSWQSDDGSDCGFSGDDSDGALWICSGKSTNTDPDANWTGACGTNNDCGGPSGGADWTDTDSDPATIAGNCGSNPYGDDTANSAGNFGEGPCGSGEEANGAAETSTDGDESPASASNPEPCDGSGGTCYNTGGTTPNYSDGITTIDADIEAVWGTVLLDDYGYFANADHSCYVSYFANILGNAYDLLSDDSPASPGTSGPGGCSTDQDGDEGTIGSLTINGAINEFWQGIFTHYEAYNGNFAATGGYASVTTNYDGRFQKNLPVFMVGPGNATWHRVQLTQVHPVCPTGQISGAGNTAAEVTVTCPS